MPVDPAATQHRSASNTDHGPGPGPVRILEQVRRNDSSDNCRDSYGDRIPRTRAARAGQASNTRRFAGFWMSRFCLRQQAMPNLFHYTKISCFSDCCLCQLSQR